MQTPIRRPLTALFALWLLAFVTVMAPHHWCHSHSGALDQAPGLGEIPHDADLLTAHGKFCDLCQAGGLTAVFFDGSDCGFLFDSGLRVALPELHTPSSPYLSSVTSRGPPASWSFVKL